MAYRFDEDLAPFVPHLPVLDLGDLDAARRADAEIVASLPPPDRSGVTVSEREVPGPPGAPDVRVRLFRPEGRRGPLPAVLDIHGGGFVLGSLASAEAGDYALCRELGAVVVAVDYRLAPETPFPGGLEDCYAALAWLSEKAADLGVDPERVAVHGFSAGGGLAAALALLCRDRGGPALCFQFLSCPELDDRGTTPSMVSYTDTPCWFRSNGLRSWECYLGEGVPGTDAVPPYAAPARATDLSGLPPAYVSVMQFDPLRDEGVAYALALLAAGVPVELHLFPGTFHGSSALPALVSQRELLERRHVLMGALRRRAGTRGA